MKQRYNEINHALCVHAALDAYDHKWSRKAFLRDASKYGGVSRIELARDELDGSVGAKIVVAEGVAYEMETRLGEVKSGFADDLDLEPVRLRTRKDGISGKVRTIASCSPMHQCFGHLLVLALMPTLRARILPCQHASIPGHGQTACKRQIERALRRGKLGIRHAQKTDIHHAYASTSAQVVMDTVAGLIPSAKEILTLLGLLLDMNPEGGLLIGGYPDAWLFNLVYSFAIREMQNMRKSRRGASKPMVASVVDYMDDAALMGPRRADVRSAVRKSGRWVDRALGLELKPGDEVSWMTAAEERRRKRAPTPGGRGCPGLDMAGYVVHRTYTTIRPAIYRRTRRQFLRAARDVARGGTMPIYRARKLIAYNGYFNQTDSRHARKVLDVDRLMTLAKAVAGHAQREETRERRKKLEEIWRKSGSLPHEDYLRAIA